MINVDIAAYKRDIESSWSVSSLFHSYPHFTGFGNSGSSSPITGSQLFSLSFVWSSCALSSTILSSRTISKLSVSNRNKFQEKGLDGYRKVIRFGEHVGRDEGGAWGRLLGSLARERVLSCIPGGERVSNRQCTKCFQLRDEHQRLVHLAKSNVYGENPKRFHWANRYAKIRIKWTVHWGAKWWKHD